MRILFVIILAIGILPMGSCAKKKAREKAEENDREIVQYLGDNNITATKTDTGLYYVIDSTTNGQKPTATDNVTVRYKGYYTNGSVFDESSAAGASFNLQSVIQGWTEGIPLFPEGAKGKLFIPAHLGYGLKDYNDIPGGSVLIFDIFLIEV
jgi:FKBP-type peptidyl-prolyl cis-trans isomerase FkpA